MRHPWVALLPAVVAAVFAALAINDDGSVAAASPYLTVVVLSILYVIRPTLAQWAVLFAAFAAYTVFVLISPWVGFAGSPTSQWMIEVALGAVPCAVLWHVRPKRIDDRVL